tara:strand:- start:1881 stop:3185 length:1305 start_codon:yes stop_codon:yes gene_type:complete
MAIKTSGDLLTLDFVNNGFPYVSVPSKNVSSDDSVSNGFPATFQTFGPANPTPVGGISTTTYTTTYVKVNSTWQEIDKFHGNIAINQSGTWRYGDTLGIRVGDYWRTNDHGTAVPTELVDSPSYLAGSSNNSYSHGSASNYWVWNNRKGLILTATDIKSYSGSGASRSYDNNYYAYSQDTFTIPSDLKWVYAVLIGGGAGGNGSGAGDGGGGGGFAFAKLDLRNHSGQSLFARSGNGGGQYSSGADSYLTINGTEVMRATGGVQVSNPNWRTSKAGHGGYGIIDESHGSYIYGVRDRGGTGTDSVDGTNGATGGGPGYPYEGGNSIRPWCGAGSGSDGGGNNKPGGVANHNYTSLDMKDNQRGIHPVDASLEYSAISSIPFFGDSTSSNAFDGKTGRPSSSSAPAAGFFGSGGGGSGSGSGFAGGPGSVILWWS